MSIVFTMMQYNPQQITKFQHIDTFGIIVTRDNTITFMHLRSYIVNVVTCKTVFV